jgi:hypothetical protein
MAWDMRLIWVRRETEYFLRGDWTTQITLIALAFSALCRTPSPSAPHSRQRDAALILWLEGTCAPGGFLYVVKGGITTMKHLLLATVAISGLLCAAKPVDAGGMGRFLGSLVARGVVREAIVAGRSNTHPSYAPKVYTSDVLTVAQLAACIKQASKLDEDSERLEATRSVFLASKSELDLSSAAVEFQRTGVDHYSQKSVDAFNALIVRHNILVTNGRAKQSNFNALVDALNVQVDAYNVACVKKYYADDLPDAQKLAAQP